jgi:hypothetical protein
VADPGGGPDQWQYSGSGIAYYVDPSYAGGSSDGSYSAPWTDFTRVNALTGDLGGRIIRLKSGQTIYDAMLINAASNFSIETYGGSTKAIIDGSVLSGWTWVQEGSTDYWSTTTPGAEKALWVGDLAFERANNGQTKPVQAVMDRCEATFWYGEHDTLAGGTGVGGVRLWVHAPHGMDMNAEETANNVRTTSIEYVLRGDGCSLVTVSNIQVQRSHSGNFLWYTHGDGITVDGLLSRQVGLGASGQNTLKIAGTSAVAPATNVIIRNSEFSDSFAGSNNNGTELEFIDGMTIEDCTYRRILGNAVEYWKTMVNTRVTRCRFEDIGNSILWLANNVAGQEHDNNQIDNCIINSTGNMANDGGTDQQGSALLRHDAGTNTRVYNNTHITNNKQCVTLATGSSANCLNTITMKNNIFVSLQSYASRARFQTLDAPTPAWTFVSAFTGAKNEIISDNNRIFSRYQTDQNTTRVGYLQAVGSYTTGLAAWQAQTGSPDPNSSEGDPLLAELLGPVVSTTTVNGAVSAGAWNITLTSAAGMVVGGYVTVAMAAAPRLHVTRIMAISGSTITGELKVGGGGISNGATVSYRTSLTGDVTPSASGVLNSGIGSATDANVPTVDFYGNARSTTAPDIGAVEA